MISPHESSLVLTLVCDLILYGLYNYSLSTQRGYRIGAVDNCPRVGCQKCRNPSLDFVASGIFKWFMVARCIVVILSSLAIQPTNDIENQLQISDSVAIRIYM